MNNIKFNLLSQIYEKHLSGVRIALYVKQNNFKAGELNTSTSTFTSVRRTSKNIMKMFSALGINEEILTQYNFEFIIVPFNGSFLRTYRAKWLLEGVRSPFCNEAVDSQILLPISQINMEGWQDTKPEAKQLLLFSEVADG